MTVSQFTMNEHWEQFLHKYKPCLSDAQEREWYARCNETLSQPHSNMSWSDCTSLGNAEAWTRNRYHSRADKNPCYVLDQHRYNPETNRALPGSGQFGRM